MGLTYLLRRYSIQYIHEITSFIFVPIYIYPFVLLERGVLGMLPCLCMKE